MIIFWSVNCKYILDIPNPPELEITLKPDMTHFGADNFTVTLEWSQFSGETYSIATVPEPVYMSFTRSTSVQLVMLYDTPYNVTVTATLCGHRNTTNFTTLYYRKKIAAYALLCLMNKILSYRL
jgi:hypothetical protein